jgi:hypothetical protein
MVRIEPTVGRVVYYIEFEGATPLAAIIAYVNPNASDFVNLMVIDVYGMPNSRTAVPLSQDDNGYSVVYPHAEWMAYQKGQAAKTEALEAQLKATV